jgi:carbonic anhydrase
MIDARDTIADREPMQNDADTALARLREGNRRFLADEAPIREIDHNRRLAVAMRQTPFAALLGCSDSRVGPETLFGTGLGDLFIVRTAGNNVDTAGMGSLEFAVAKLAVPLIVVLGHDHCGVVEAAFDVVENDVILPGSMGKMVEPVVPAVLWAKRQGAHKTEGDGNIFRSAARENVRRMVRRLRTASEPVLMEPLALGRLKIVGAHYDLQTGAVEFFDVE